MILRQCYYHQRWQPEQQLNVRRELGNPPAETFSLFLRVFVLCLLSRKRARWEGARPWGYTDDADVAVIV